MNSTSANELANRLLITLSYLIRAVEDGGAATETHLNALLEWTVELLHELGGFEEVLAQYAAEQQG
jgi:hypothetical protein